MSEELKPCPFCGSKAIYLEDGSTHRWVVMKCADCEATSGEIRKELTPEMTNASANKAWNTRTTDTEILALRAEILRLTERLFVAENHKCSVFMAEKLQTAEAEVARLREALQVYKDMGTSESVAYKALANHSVEGKETE